MSQPSQHERKYPRIDLQNLVVISRVEKEFRKQNAETCSVGLGGCGLVLDEPMETGSRLVLFLSLGHQVAKVDARVAYSRGLEDGRHEVGVEFLEIGSRHRRAIRRMLEGEQELSEADRRSGLGAELVALILRFLDQHPDLSPDESVHCLEQALGDLKKIHEAGRKPEAGSKRSVESCGHSKIECQCDGDETSQLLGILSMCSRSERRTHLRVSSLHRGDRSGSRWRKSRPSGGESLLGGGR